MMRDKRIWIALGTLIFLEGETTVQAGTLSDATADSLWGIQLGGYLDVSYIYNLNDPKQNQGGNVMRVFDVDHNEFNFQMLQFTWTVCPRSQTRLVFESISPWARIPT